MHNLLCHCFQSPYEIGCQWSVASCQKELQLASDSYLLVGGFLVLGGAFQDAKDFFLAHDQEVFAVNLDLGAGVLAKQDAVAFLHIEREGLAFVVGLARPTAITSPSCGLSLALSGMMIPPRVVSASSTRRTTMRSCRGVSFVAILKLLFLVVLDCITFAGSGPPQRVATSVFMNFGVNPRRWKQSVPSTVSTHSQRVLIIRGLRRDVKADMSAIHSNFTAARKILGIPL